MGVAKPGGALFSTLGVVMAAVAIAIVTKMFWLGLLVCLGGICIVVKAYDI